MRRRDDFYNDYNEFSDPEDDFIGIHANLDHSYDAEDPEQEKTFWDQDQRIEPDSYEYTDENFYDENIYDENSYSEDLYEEDSYRGNVYEEDAYEDARFYDDDGEAPAADHVSAAPLTSPPKKVRNRQIMGILYAFLAVFFAMIGYFVYFDVIQSEDVTNNPNNIRIAKMSETITRGKIISSDGQVLAETLKDSEGNEYRNYPYANMFAHSVGLSKTNRCGIEIASEYYLLQSNINPIQKIANELRNEKSPGDHVITTLNYELQKTAYEALGNQQGAVIAMEPQTGKVLAMVSKPDFNPNTIAQDYEAILQDSESKVLLNQATSGLFTPGSIFKPITTLEYLREYPNASNYQYTCSGSIALNSEDQTNYLSCYNGHVHGTQDLTASFANSCNASYANIGLNLSISRLNELCDSLYFNQSLPTDIAHVNSQFSLGENASQWEIGTTAIGQGNTLITPLHALMITGAIANGGVVMRPYLVDSVKNTTGNVVEAFAPESSGSLMSASEAIQLKDMMKAVVSYGTASSLSWMGYDIAGKTGTAEVDGSGNNAWFIGFAPADNPQIAVCVLVENSSTSSSYAAVPIAAELFQNYLK